MKKYIESTRSADRPHCGDRVRYVSRHGDYAGSALIAYDRNDMLTVCIYPYDPFASRTNDGVQCCSSGGPFTHVAAAAFRYEGPRRGSFKIWGHDGPCGNGSIRFEAEVAGWSYREPDPLYGDFTTEAWRRLYVYRIERPCGSDLYRTNGREIGDEAAFQTFLHDYKATVFPGRLPRQLVVWCYRPAERPLPQEQWDALDAPIVDCRIYNVPQPVKILYDDLRHERIVYYVPPTLHIH
ncbi:DUF4121 family protein, partial [Alistipes putredinis]|uniref:DUF4121 family protein n=1 Tax=Alistipes putredinis TaxID=28117 RepID=UPI003AB71262